MQQEFIKPAAFEEKAEEARMTCLAGGMAVSDMVKSTLGPCGLTKLLYKPKGKLIVTNDGASILRNIRSTNPSAQILINAAIEHSEVEGDGSTTLTVLTGLLLSGAERLVSRGLHPNLILNSYRIALNKAIDCLETISLKATDENLHDIARTALSSKLPPNVLDHIASVCVGAASRVSSIEMINILKIPGGQLVDTHMDEGLLLECEVGAGQKKSFQNPRIIVANTSLDSDRIKIFGARAAVDSPAALKEVEKAEKERLLEKVEQISAVSDVIINRQLIYDFQAQEFSRRGKISIERADFSGVEMLARVLNARILSTFDLVSEEDIGRCENLESLRIGVKKLIRFSGLRGKGACTIVIRGSGDEMMDEIERSIKGAIKVLMKRDRIVWGGGAAEAAAACMIEGETEGEKEFSKALMEIPWIIAENCGNNGQEVVEGLRRKNREGERSWGVDIGGGVCCTREKGICEPYKLKRKIWSTALETAEVIIRCDGVITCPQRKRTRE